MKCGALACRGTDAMTVCLPINSLRKFDKLQYIRKMVCRQFIPEVYRVLSCEVAVS